MDKLKKDPWWIASSEELKNTPLAKRLFGMNVVLFRDSIGSPVAFEDKCPHRGLSLSLGKVESGKLRCAYHGWVFDKNGACVEIPCLSSNEKIQKKVGPVQYPCLEKNGSIWIIPTPSEKFPENFLGWAEPPENTFRVFELINTIRCPMEWILDNFVDCGHTGFVHQGLFRGAPEKEVHARIEETPTGLRIETLGEAKTESFLAKIFIRGDGKVEHIDEFILPHTVKVNYRFGPHWIQTVSVCTPIDDQSTKVVTRVWVHFAPFTWIVSLVMKWMTRKILLQDIEILENQAKQFEIYGPPEFTSTAADTPTLWLSRRLKEYRSGKMDSVLRKTETSYKI